MPGISNCRATPSSEGFTLRVKSGHWGLLLLKDSDTGKGLSTSPGRDAEKHGALSQGRGAAQRPWQRGKLPPTPGEAPADPSEGCGCVRSPSHPAGVPGAVTPAEVFQLCARRTWSPDGREAPEGFAEIKEWIWLGDMGQTG